MKTPRADITTNPKWIAEQTDRLLVMKRFKAGEFKILIATDVSARGIDIPNVDFVLPDFSSAAGIN